MMMFRDIHLIGGIDTHKNKDRAHPQPMPPLRSRAFRLITTAIRAKRDVVISVLLGRVRFSAIRTTFRGRPAAIEREMGHHWRALAAGLLGGAL